MMLYYIVYYTIYKLIYNIYKYNLWKDTAFSGQELVYSRGLVVIFFVLCPSPPLPCNVLSYRGMQAKIWGKHEALTKAKEIKG